MRLLAFGVASLCLALPATVGAESAGALRARGEQFAKDRRYSEAIDAFKAADRLEPRALHACLIALAYTRREAWPQAEIFLDQCEKRATPADPLPDWVPTAKQQLAERLAAVNVAAVEIVVVPAGVAAKLAVSSFAPDELFEPRTIHVPPGRHSITVTAKGYRDMQQTVEVKDRTPQRVSITMVPVATEPPPTVERPSAAPSTPAPSTPQPSTAAPASKLPVIVMGVGGALAVAGGAIHATLFRTARADMVDAAAMGDKAAFDDAEQRFDRYRALSIGFYAAGAVTLGTGIVLALTRHESKEPVHVTVSPIGDRGGMVTVGWTQ